MELLRYTSKKLLCTLPILFGVSLLSFLFMAYFGSDLTYSLLGKNATLQDLEDARKSLNYDLGFFHRYFLFLKEILSFDFGSSGMSHEKVSDLLKSALPISIALNLPGFIIGNILALLLSLYAAAHEGQCLDRLLLAFSSIGMSLSYVIVIIGFQAIFSSSSGFDLFPVHGWDSHSLASYLKHVFVPTLATIFVSLGYNVKFFRSILIEEMKKPYVKTFISLGSSSVSIMVKWVLKNTLISILTRIVFSIPYVFIEGSLLLETFFGIPGIGVLFYNALIVGDLPVIKAVVSLGIFVYIAILVITDLLYKILDPRINLS